MATVKEAKTESQEEKLAKLTAEVQALRQELHRAQRLATVGTMTAMVAHEFNNILTPIINYAQLAKSNPRMVEKAIARASEGGQRATEICKAILGITRDESPEPSRENLGALVREVLSAMGRNPRSDGIDMTVDIPRNLGLTTRRLELQQVLLNLIVNARKAVMANPAPRRIEISAVKESKNIVIRVSDNGGGIGPEIIDKIFQPFFTTNTTADDGKSKGHGLGLAICREIITSLDGQITVASTVGEGTTFTIRLPA